MKKWLKVLFTLVALVVITILGAGLYFYLPYIQSEPNAILNIERGNVEVDSGKGFVNAKDGMKLQNGLIVKTNNDAEVSVTFLGSSETRLNENSELEIKSVDDKEGTVYLEQVEGEIWYDTLDGVDITFVIETPDGTVINEGSGFTIATPRMSSSRDTTLSRTQISTSRGLVRLGIGLVISKPPSESAGLVASRTMSGDIKTLINSIRTDPVSTTTVNSGITTVIENKKVSSITLFSPTVWEQKNIAEDADFVIKRRVSLKKKYARNIRLAKNIFPQLTDELLDQYIDKVLIGELNVNDKIKDGTIPKTAVRFIPRELSISSAKFGDGTVILSEPTNINSPTTTTQPCPTRYRVNCEALLSCTLIYNVVKDNNFLTFAQEHIDFGREQVKNLVADLEKGKSDDKKGKWTGQDIYTYRYELTTKGWGVGCSCGEAFSACTNNIGTANTRSISFDLVKGTYFSTNVNCGAKNPKQISCEKI